MYNEIVYLGEYRLFRRRISEKEAIKLCIGIVVRQKTNICTIQIKQEKDNFVCTSHEAENDFDQYKMFDMPRFL